MTSTIPRRKEWHRNGFNDLPISWLLARQPDLSLEDQIDPFAFRRTSMISQQQCQNATILIVDDQMTNVMLLESILQNAGYTHVHSTQDATQVVPMFKELKPDLICLDIRMPELNGFQVMGQLKIIHTATPQQARVWLL